MQFNATGVPHGHSAAQHFFLGFHEGCAQPRLPSHETAGKFRGTSIGIRCVEGFGRVPGAVERVQCTSAEVQPRSREKQGQKQLGVHLEIQTENLVSLCPLNELRAKIAVHEVTFFLRKSAEWPFIVIRIRAFRWVSHAISSSDSESRRAARRREPRKPLYPPYNPSCPFHFSFSLPFDSPTIGVTSLYPHMLGKTCLHANSTPRPVSFCADARASPAIPRQRRAVESVVSVLCQGVSACYWGYIGVIRGLY